MDMRSLLIHGGVDGDAATGAVSVPIYQTSTYRFEDFTTHKGFDYSRAGNPTRDALEKLVAQLEGGYGGYAFASGMAAITAVLTLFRTGDRILLSDNVYGGTFRVLNQVLVHFGITFELVNTNDIEALKEKLVPEVKALFVETPTNPLMDITDIRKVSAFTKANGLLLIVDNTFMTPYLQKPLELGADIVVHSATKYLGGHSDLLAGLVVTNTQALADRIYFIQKSTGGILNPFDAWLLIRGIKTLSVRLQRHQENARQIAEYLRNHPAVERVYYPGFEDHPGHLLHKSQARGFGAMVSFVLDSWWEPQRFVKELKLITYGESLGGVESLLTHPASMTHASIPPQVRQEIGIVDNLLRFSVGLEEAQDLIDELDGAFAAAARG